MKIGLDIPDNRVPFMLELVQSLPFVKARPLPIDFSDEKALFIAEFGGSPLMN